MKFFYALICIITFSQGFSQCPTTSIALNSQAEVDAFVATYPGCTQATYGLSISGADITSLASLSGLTAVGNFEISNCPQLVSLAGLENLSVLESPPSQGGVSIRINNNVQLTSVTALANLSNNEEMDIYITANPLLESFAGLENLQGIVYSFEIVNNDSITDFDGFSGIVNTDDFFVADNDNLQSFAGLDSFTISGSMIINNNPVLTAFDFPNLVDPYCGFTITDNILLTDIDGFVLASSDLCGVNISISGNASLSNCAISYICDVLPDADSVFIENNSNFCSSINSVEFACELAACPPSGYVFDTQQKVDDFATLYPDCTEMHLGITGDDVTDLSPLNQLTSLEGFFIQNTSSLVNLNGLENVLNIEGYIGLGENTSLIDISAIGNATGFAHNDLYILNNPVLASLDGLSGIVITNIWGEEQTEGRIEGNDALLNLIGLELLNIPSHFTITNNENLISLEGLSPTTGIGGAGSPGQSNSGFLAIDNNPSLVSLSALSNLTLLSAGGIEITNNESLESLGWDGTVEGGNHEFIIVNNPNLVICDDAVTCNLLEISTYQFPAAALEIRNNGPACDNPVVMANNCGLNLNSIQGVVNNRPTEVSDCNVPLENVVVKTVKGGSTRRSTTNSNGEYFILVGEYPNFITSVESVPDLGFDYITTPGEVTTSFNNTAETVAVIDFCIQDALFTLNRIEGTVQFDFDLDGCTLSDYEVNNILIDVTDTSSGTTYSTVTNDVGYYKALVPAGDYTVSVNSNSLPEFFEALPNSISFSFADAGEIEQADFCLSATQSFNDVSIDMVFIFEARPGFESTYQLIYENKGTNIVSGSLSFQFDDARQSFVSATQTPASTTANQLNFDYQDLLPFEQRSFIITMYNFEPPVNEADDELVFNLEIEPIVDDANPDDNTIEIVQIYINSQDPNDKQVTQGEEIYMEQVGDYLTYIVRFQNVGTASAINVRVEDLLEENLQTDSFRMLSSSHEYRLEIIDGNQLIFYFDGINLPAEEDDEEGSNGYVAFKVRSNEDLEIGDTVENTADIYFDFNDPIVTNTVITTIVENLGVDESLLASQVNIFPIPTSEILNIQTDASITFISASLRSVLGEDVIAAESNVINVSAVAAGIYFIEVVTDQGTLVKKIIKE